ncbi:hypothetical protein RvY_08735-2 [Ramazzottius varieornatus]|uniref:DNA-directed RNA polymerase subunit n=1 Tax=Ramazzottius varieornatus TaxID=947166 RepID=A0A1D1V713_RAMVA|nr:hypothetical protein RvY_08735-2 [Ramazzottius varieornatus]
MQITVDSGDDKDISWRLWSHSSPTGYSSFRPTGDELPHHRHGMNKLFQSMLLSMALPALTLFDSSAPVVRDLEIRRHKFESQGRRQDTANITTVRKTFKLEAFPFFPEKVENSTRSCVWICNLKKINMDWSKKRQTPTHRIKGIEFGVYSTEEIRSLSMVQVSSPSTIDLLQRKVINGPHDPKLGAFDRGELCPVCYQSSRSCPGHMGHIEFPVPIFNPILFRTLIRILRGSCVKCKLLICEPASAAVFLHQMEALDMGRPDIAYNLPEHAHHYLVENQGAQLDDLEDHLNEVFTEMTARDPTTPDRGEHSEKLNLLEEKHKLLSDFMRHKWKSNRTCLVCKDRNWKLKDYYGSKITYTIAEPTKSNKKSGKKPAKKSTASGSKPVTRASGKKPAVASPATGGVTNAEPEVAVDSAKPPNSNADGDNDEEAEKAKAEDEAPEDSSAVKPLSSIEAREYLREVWDKNSALLRRLFPMFDMKEAQYPTDVLFMELMFISPSRFRPQRFVNEEKYSHVQTKNIERIVTMCQNIKILKKIIREGADASRISGILLLEKIPGKTLEAKLQEASTQLQTFVNSIFDGETDRYNPEYKNGVKQIMEKKEGLFRMHMMGKRVNYSARSVISPDPYINLNEIGVPMVFATKLTYPVFVTPNNLLTMQKMVMNGPDIYPGAVMVENEDGTMIRLTSNEKQRATVAKSLAIDGSQRGGLASGGGKKVYRHLLNGDIMLLNRQPTLHKTSIMAHKARILPSEKTLRLHYANCKSYNADFDGDEMNAHLPQDEVARSEAYNIVNASYQYLVPKDGTPLSGLIQDHIVAGVHLTIRGRFFEKKDYEQLVYSALGDIHLDHPIRFLAASILKPARMWSGKQIVSTIVINLIPEGFTPFSLRTGSKVPLKSWSNHRHRKSDRRSRYVRVSPNDEKDMTESDVIFRRGELLCGVLDKAQYGPSSYGLVHACYELYGGDISALLLSALARLFTYFLQLNGFTLGVEDVLVLPKADATRRKIIASVEDCGADVAVSAFNLDGDTVTTEMIKDRIEKAHRAADQTDMKVLDGMTKQKVDEFNSEITRVCMPNGLVKGFPENHLQTMVLSGAKGATVNCIQMSCLLGQIELEGARPPLMLSGRTLPSFVAYEATPRSGGFVVQRFATGLRPQEYFFHCMAGREGLIDTAVKTSRSGYLQRCIMKHLEGVMVNYDLTVRDSDAAIVQFLYGEDGLDIGRLPFYSEKQLPFLMVNTNEAMEKEMALLKDAIGDNAAFGHDQKVSLWKKKMTKEASKKERGLGNTLQEFGRKNKSTVSDDKDFSPRVDDGPLAKRSKIVDPTIAVYRPDRHLGALSEKMGQVMEKYLADPPLAAIRQSSLFHAGRSPPEIVRDLISFKYVESLAQPGEAVGALAAQSIGEPSTQMTLNTFHFAGRGEMNVTLGIPRLREILMTASKTIKTPTMEVPVKLGQEQEAENLRVRLNRVVLGQVIEYLDITTNMEVQDDGQPVSVLELFIKLLPAAEIASMTCLTSSGILQTFEKVVVRRLLETVKVKVSLKQLVKSGKDDMVDPDVEAIEDNGQRGRDDDEDGADGGGTMNRRGGGKSGQGQEAVDDDNESVNSDDEAGDPDAAKAQLAADGGQYMGDKEDSRLLEEWDHEPEEGDEMPDEDKENSVMSEKGQEDGLTVDPNKTKTKPRKSVKMNEMRREVICFSNFRIFRPKLK